MAMPAPNPTIPKTFISSSFEEVEHNEWVKRLATRLKADGVEVTLGLWDRAQGVSIPLFMERAIRQNDCVIVICTPQFKEKSDERRGVVGYGARIMADYALKSGNKKKFISVLRRGKWSEAAPAWLLERPGIDLSEDPSSKAGYEKLLRTLREARKEAMARH